MKKSTLGFVAAGAAALGLAGGGTFAGWSDFNVQDEQVQAGHLTLNVGESALDTGDPLRLAPGINVSRTFYIASNDGQSVPSGNISVTLMNLVDSENLCENNGEADAEAPTRLDGPGANPLDTDLVTTGARCNNFGDVGELSKVASAQWRWTEPVSSTTDCDSLPTYAGQYGTPVGAYPFTNAATSGFIGNMDNIPTAIETLAPGQGICLLFTVNVQQPTHPSTPVHQNSIQGDTLDFDFLFTLTQA